MINVLINILINYCRRRKLKNNFFRVSTEILNAKKLNLKINAQFTFLFSSFSDDVMFLETLFLVLHFLKLFLSYSRSFWAALARHSLS